MTAKAVIKKNFFQHVIEKNDLINQLLFEIIKSFETILFLDSTDDVPRCGEIDFRK